MKINLKKVKFYLELHWIKIVVLVTLAGVSAILFVLIKKGLESWTQVGPYYKQSQLAMIPIQLFLQIVMALIFGVVYTFMMYWLYFKGGHRSFTAVKKSAVAGEQINIRWNDVIGMEEAKREALEVVRLVTDRAHLKRIGGQILRGLLMLGPPGCGKTYLAKAIATEAGLPFISMSGSEFVEMFVGVGAGRVRNLFKQARQLAEFEGGCIVFIDEIDAVGAQRSGDRGFGGQTEHNTTVNQLLVEMDGIKEKEANVIVIAATNMAETFLDPALLRPGRFDRKIYVDLPNLKDREKLFAYYLSKVSYDRNDVKIDRLAKLAVESSPADISNIIRESALITVRNGKESITMKEVTEAMDRIELGLRRSIDMTEEQLKKVAYHEAGHAIIAYLLHPQVDVLKATIVPRKTFYGAVVPRAREDEPIKDKDYYLASIKVGLGSYAAERLKFNTSTSGVNQDFLTATWTAYNMVWRWGMGPSGLLGNFAELEDVYNTSRWGSRNVISEKTKEKLDMDVQQIMKECLTEAEVLLKKELPLLDRFAQELITKKELNYDEIEAIFKQFNKARPSP
ncbi:MAG: AAA family ATPase [Candidatus Omnitrophica bacterium]|nr:AAA family ATPase [Candidatus Omnitrophota bacterium]MDD5611359.1 AAA family ATPase [Candidatus Omnitrophota bacterium]